MPKPEKQVEENKKPLEQSRRNNLDLAGIKIRLMKFIDMPNIKFVECW